VLSMGRRAQQAPQLWATVLVPPVWLPAASPEAAAFSLPRRARNGRNEHSLQSPPAREAKQTAGNHRPTVYPISRHSASLDGPTAGHQTSGAVEVPRPRKTCPVRVLEAAGPIPKKGGDGGSKVCSPVCKAVIPPVGELSDEQDAQVRARPCAVTSRCAAGCVAAQPGESSMTYD